MHLTPHLARLWRNQDGAMLIETAIVAPVLVLMSLGAFQVSGMIARQSELQSAAAESAAIALAASPDNAAERDTIKQVIMTSTGLPESKVTVTEMFRCGSNTSLVATATGCGTGERSRYVKIDLTDTYTPEWVNFGVGTPMTYRVTRYVMLGQEDD